MVVSLILFKANQHYASPVLAMINRWLRWFVVAGALAEIGVYFSWLGRPFWVLWIIFFIGWFLLDSIYRWLAIQAVSVSPLPLFPRFTLNKSGEEWPVDGRFLKLRERLRARGLSLVQSLRAEVATSYYLRLSVYQNKDASIRVQVAFLPQPVGGLAVCFQLATRLADGDLLITDNHYLPFAGFYPENWLVERKPNIRGFDKLFQRHRRRLDAVRRAIDPWSAEPLTDLNAQQVELERLNTEMGFLLPGAAHEEHGRISYEGRYRVWKEMLSLNYFGVAARYY